MTLLENLEMTMKTKPKKATINGVECRYYYAGKIYVSRDGTVAGALRSTGIKPVSIIVDDGEKYAKVNKNKLVAIEQAVMKCYCPPKPVDTKRYCISHKDGDKLNCDADNLEWAIDHYEHTTDPSIDLRCLGKKITVFKDGHVEQDGKPVTIHDSWYDSDVDLEVSYGPHIKMAEPKSLYYLNYTLDEIMKVAGYVQGDDMIFDSPQILHIDNDMMNCSADNLMWVDASDSRYKAYESKRKADMHQRTVELNPGRHIPDFL